MIRAIVFDCFGVLATDGWLPFKTRYFGQDAQKFQEASDLGRAADAGLIGFDEFIEHVALLANMPDADARHQIENNVPNEALFVYIARELKARYKIGMLSNAGANWLSELFTPEQVALFDAVALSYETGALKPTPRAYEVIAERLRVQPQECVFIDDQTRYCAGATESGMVAICYTDFDTMQHDLARVLADAKE
ncbi:MAG TPA: HAD-IA family hydrolase [Candidatus Saccharimonadales bacterium]|nr:HAD-IA family hydrolase [Candidatus Saccharimonadales bacterium]